MDNVFIVTDGQNFCGNGFIIKDGLALTNSHVLRDGGSCFLHDGDHVEFVVIKDFRKEFSDTPYELYDYALIYSESFTPKSDIVIRETEVKRLEVLSTVAFSKEIETIQKCTGYCNFPLNKTRNTGSIVFDNGSMPVLGNSGCPVIDRDSQIVGLFFGLNRQCKTAYFIKMDYIISIISSIITYRD